MSWVLAPVVALLALHLLVARMEVRALYGLCNSYERLHESDKNLQQANDTLPAPHRRRTARRQGVQLNHPARTPIINQEQDTR